MPRRIHKNGQFAGSPFTWIENWAPAKIARLDTPCWECNSHKPDRVRGYPTTCKGGTHSSIHRYLYEVLFGHLPVGGLVRHRCDNPPCINPEHWASGTQADNKRDQIERGRWATGERHGRSKVSEEQVRSILRSQEPGGVLSKRYGVGVRTIWQIRARVNWKHVQI